MAQAMALKADDGYYHVFSGYYKIVTSPKTHNSYAKKFNPETKSWEYAPGAVTKLRAEFKIGLEGAKQFGALYGRCIRCSRTLTAEESIEKAMGPVCSGKM